MGRRLSMRVPTAFKNWIPSLNLRRSMASSCFSLSPITGTHNLSTIKLPGFPSALAMQPQERTRSFHEIPWATTMVNKVLHFENTCSSFPLGGMDAYVREFSDRKNHDDFYVNPTILAKFTNYTTQIVSRYVESPRIFAWYVHKLVGRWNSIWSTSRKGNCQWSKVHYLLHPHLHIVEASKLDATLRCQPPLSATLRQ